LRDGHSQWRCVGRSFKELKTRLQPRCTPRNQRATGGFIDAQTDAIKNLFCAEAAFTHHLGEGWRVSGIRPRLVWSDSAWRRIERDQHPLVRLNQRQPTGQRGTGLDKRGAPGGVDHDDGRLHVESSKRLDVVG
jgi:hypothetical protein